MQQTLTRPPLPPVKPNKFIRGFGPITWAVLAIVLVCFIVMSVSGTISNALSSLTPSCTVGTVGVPTNITFQGSASSTDCDMFVQQYPQQYYHMTNTADGETMCEGDIPQQYYLNPPNSYYQYYMPNGLQEVLYTVKSAFGYNAIGSAICSALIGPTQ